MISDQYLPKAVSFQIVNVFFEIHSPDKVNKQHMYSYTTEEHILGHPFDW